MSNTILSYAFPVIAEESVLAVSINGRLFLLFYHKNCQISHGHKDWKNSSCAIAVSLSMEKKSSFLNWCLSEINSILFFLISHLNQDKRQRLKASLSISTVPISSQSKHRSQTEAEHRFTASQAACSLISSIGYPLPRMHLSACRSSPIFTIFWYCWTLLGSIHPLFPKNT